MRALTVYESLQFKRRQNPMAAMDIGRLNRIKDWMKKVKIDPSDYVIDENFNITVFTPDNLIIEDYTDWKTAKKYKGMTIYGDTKVDYILENMTVYGGVMIQKSFRVKNYPINSIPSSFKPLSFLDLRGWAGASLPDNFTIGGDLDIMGSSISSWPKNLTVGGTLNIKDTRLLNIPLPDDLIVKSGRIIPLTLTF